MVDKMMLAADIAGVFLKNPSDSFSIEDIACRIKPTDCSMVLIESMVMKMVEDNAVEKIENSAGVFFKYHSKTMSEIAEERRSRSF